MGAQLWRVERKDVFSFQKPAARSAFREEIETRAPSRHREHLQGEPLTTRQGQGASGLTEHAHLRADESGYGCEQTVALVGAGLACKDAADEALCRVALLEDDEEQRQVREHEPEVAIPAARTAYAGT